MVWFNNIKIRNKLFIVFGLLLCIAVFFAVFAITGITSVGDNLTEMINSNQARQILLADAIADVYKIRLTNMSTGYLVEDELKEPLFSLQMNHEENIELFRKNLFTFREIVLSDRRLAESEKRRHFDLVNEIEDIFDEYVAVTGELHAAAEKYDRRKIVRIIDKSTPVGNELSNKVQELGDLTFSALSEKTAKILDTTFRTVNITSGISVAFILLAVFILLFTVRNINRPITNLEKAAAEIAKGNLSYPIRSERGDELGVLSNCIGDMIDEIVKYSKMTAIMDNLDSMICVSDLDYNLLFINKQLADTFNVDRETCIGQKCYQVMRQKNAPCPFCQMAELLPQKESLPSKDYEYIWDDYLNTWISGNDSIIRWADGSKVFFHSERDSAQKKRQEELLQESLKAVEMASAAKSSFLANMSHEIRTPMNVILGVAEIQLQDETLAPNIREALTQIYSSGDLLLSIINDILDLSKIEAGKLEISPREYEVASLINDTVALNMMQIGEKPIEFVLSVDENTPSILLGDELRIKQILNNLLSNAFKYTAKGVVKLSVSVEADEEESESEGGVTLVFSVSDTGQGMTEEQVAKLFDEYSRFNTEANRTTVGTGLGMSIARNLTNMMHGRIAVKSEVYLGSVFTVRLPQKRTNSTVLGKEIVENLQNFQLNGAKQIRKAQIVYEPMPYGSVLIVDDVESNLYVAKGLLGPYGLSIDTAVSGMEAIEKVKDGSVYDIVFMDHMMPKMDGMEAMKILRKLGYTEPIVALTANTVAGQADVFFANGFDGFISKPIDMRQLYVVLKKFIRDKQPPEIVEAARRQKGEQKEQKAAAQPLEPQLAEFFVKDAFRSVAALKKIYEKGDALNGEDIRMYTTNVHAMKSALANVGEGRLSVVAAKLEQAGRAEDTAVISSETPAFLSMLRETMERLNPHGKAVASSEPVSGDHAYLCEKLLILKEACEAYDKKTAKSAMAELRQKTWPHPTEELLGTMAEHLLTGDFEEVLNAAEKIIRMK